jgi:predicted methyltransferase
MIEELIQRVFTTRNAAHLEHWRTKSFSAHMALGAFYDEIIDNIDSIVEAHQGVFDLVDIKSLPAHPRVKDIVEHLQEDLVFIGENRKKITNNLPAIDNLLQTLEGTYMHALYKLTKLS